MGLHGLFWPSASANRGLFLRSGEDFRYNWDLKVSGREWGNRDYKEYCEECCHSSRAQIEALQYHSCEEEQPATRYTICMNALSTWVIAILICFCNTKEELWCQAEAIPPHLDLEKSEHYLSSFSSILQHEDSWQPGSLLTMLLHLYFLFSNNPPAEPNS